MENKNIIFNYTLEQYNKKYRNRRHRLLKYTKKQVEEFDKQYGHFIYNNKTYNLENSKYLLKDRKWALIGDSYYEIPRPVRYTWFRNLNAGVQAISCLVGAGVVTTAIAVPVVLLNQDNKFNIILDSTDSSLTGGVEKDGSIKVKIIAKDSENKFVKSVTVLKGTYELKNDEYNFDITNGELTISAKVAKKHSGDVVIKTTIDDIKEDHIEVGTKPTVNYQYADSLDLSGMKINMVNNNGSKKDITSECTTDHKTGDFLLSVGKMDINVTHTTSQKTTSFEINVGKRTYELDSTPNIDIDHPENLYFKGYKGNHIGVACLISPNRNVLSFNKIDEGTESYYKLSTNWSSVGKGGNFKLTYRDDYIEYYDVKNIDLEIASFNKVKIENNKVSKISIGETSGNLVIPSRYWDNQTKKWITIDTIPNEAFKGCTYLTRVTIPSSITTIGTDAFKDCANLVDVCIENDTVAAYSDKNKFQGLLDNAVSVKILQSGASRINYPYFDQGEATTGLFNTTSTEGVQELALGALIDYKYHYFEKVTPELKDKLYYDGNNTFIVDRTESKLTQSVADLYIPNYFHRLIDGVDTVGRITDISIKAFEDLNNLKSIYFPNQIKGTYAINIIDNMYNLPGVEKVHLPNVIESNKIDPTSFEKCSLKNLFIYKNYYINNDINEQFSKMSGYINLCDFSEKDDIFRLSPDAFEELEEEGEYKCKGIIFRNEATKTKYLKDSGYKDLQDKGMKFYIAGEEPAI